MTDKETIIDGIDVSGCEFLWKEKLPKRVCNNGNLDCDCNSNPNCYYKQLKRKEQECKNLKEELRFYRRSIKDISIESTEICKILEKYKQALDKIEEFCTVYSDNHDAYETVYKQILDFISKSEVNNDR